MPFDEEFGMFMSYDYEELLQEFKGDVLSGEFKKDTVFIEREDRSDTTYSPIVDWYYSFDEVPKGVTVEKTTPQKVIDEMVKYNSMF